ncbi:MAG: hypothetical protein ABWJ97_01735 [Thermoproteus sp.]
MEAIELRPVGEDERREVASIMEGFGPVLADITLVFIDKDKAWELYGVKVDKAKAVAAEGGGYMLLVVSPDKLSIWRELAAINALNDIEAIAVWARPEYIVGELAELLSMALYRRVVDLYIARRDVQLLASTFNPQDVPIEADELKRSLIYTVGLDVTISIAVAGFTSLAEELYLRAKRTPIYDIYTRFRNFVIKNFKFEYIYNYLNLFI